MKRINLLPQEERVKASRERTRGQARPPKLHNPDTREPFPLGAHGRIAAPGGRPPLPR